MFQSFELPQLYQTVMSTSLSIPGQSPSLSDFCCCSPAPLSELSTPSKDLTTHFFPSSPRSLPQNKSLKPKAKPKRVRKNTLPDLEKYHQELLGQIQAGSFRRILPTAKTIRGVHRNTSGRRSRYIGVSKNGNNWQVMVNLRNFKKYVGTFQSEEEAALVNDFYTITYEGSDASTNFTYGPEDVQALIESYYSNSKVFNPSLFLGNTVH